MSLISEKRLKLGIDRLLKAPLDLKRYGALVLENSAPADRSPQQRLLFQAYMGDLRQVIPEARRIWNCILADCFERTKDREKATIQALNFQPAGAAFDGCVVGIIRQYWLACAELNKRLPEEERVSPQTFLLSWLIDARYDDAVEVLAGMPYWPIGLNKAGEWV